MAKSINIVAFHKSKKEGGKDFAKQVGNLIVPDEVVDMLISSNNSIGVCLNHIPDVIYTAKPFPDDRPKQSSGQSRY